MKQFKSKLTIQLHNAKSGKLEKELEISNFAANQTSEYGKWLQKDTIKSGLSGLGVSDPVLPAHTTSNVLVLTDSVKTEDSVNEWYMPGATIGWASKATYAGTDIWRGTVATTDLEATPDYVKWVFDWPSHAGNGNIGSIGWIDSQHQVLSATEPQIRQSMTRIADYPSAGSWTRLAMASSILGFGNTGNTTIYVLDGAFVQTTTFDISAQFTSVAGIAWDSTNSFLWVTGDDSGANKIIAAYDQAGTLQTGPFTLTNRAYSLLAHDGTNLWSITPVSGTTYTLWSINPADGSDITNFNIDINVNNGICGFCWDSTNSIFWTRQYTTSGSHYPGLQAWDSSGNKASVELTTSRIYTPASNNYGTNIGTTSANTRRDIDTINGYEFAVPSSTTVYMCRADGMGTRAKLPSPVSKNNTQTLKVIYQINYV